MKLHKKILVLYIWRVQRLCPPSEK